MQRFRIGRSMPSTTRFDREAHHQDGRVNPCQYVSFLIRCRLMDEKILPASFYQNSLGTEPVRDWLKDLDRDNRLIIGGDIKTVEFGWPIGMPTCKPIGKGLYEVRSNLSSNRIARVIFCIYDERMVLLHAFIKKTQKTPKRDLDLALERKSKLELHSEK
jgi:phage-related protein